MPIICRGSKPNPIKKVMVNQVNNHEDIIRYKTEIVRLKNLLYTSLTDVDKERKKEIDDLQKMYDSTVSAYESSMRLLREENKILEEYVNNTKQINALDEEHTKQRVEDLQHKLKVIERNIEDQKKASTTTPVSSPKHDSGIVRGSKSLKRVSESQRVLQAPSQSSQSKPKIKNKMWR